MLRITPDLSAPGTNRLKLAGRLSAEEVELLAGELKRWFSRQGALVLDLDGLQFIDAPGFALLQRWTAQGLALQGGSWFIRQLLRAHGFKSG